MELSAGSSSLSRSLCVLPTDCLTHILSYDVDNIAVKLILTGDKKLIHKVSRTSHLSISWTKSGFAYWSAVSPLVRSFPKLESLHLTVWSPSVPAQGPVNAGIFSSSLRRLSLRYCGCVSLLTPDHAPTLFKELTLLEELVVLDESTAFSSPIWLSYFPASLRSLSIQPGHLNTEVKRVSTDFADLASLPPALETLHLHARNNKTWNYGVDYVWPTHLASITDLSISVNSDQKLDISVLGPTLRRLAFAGGRLFSKSEDDVLASSVNLKRYFPALTSLNSRHYELSDWIQLQDLPPTLTALHARIDDLLEPSKEQDFALLAKLNRECDVGGVLRHAAPKTLRRIEVYDHKLFWPSSLLVHFTLLHNRADGYLRAYTRDMQVSTLHGLTSLKVDCSFTEAMVHALPRSLETLSFWNSETPVLEAIVSRSEHGELPHLSTMVLVALDIVESKPIPLTASTIPKSLTKLDINCLPDTEISLVQHHQLKSLTIDRTSLDKLLPSLPPQLTFLKVTLAEQLDLALPKDALFLHNAMCRYLPSIRELTITRDSRNSPSTNAAPKQWFKALSFWNRPQLKSLGEWLALPMALKRLYATYYLYWAQPKLLRSSDFELQLTLASEYFALSCLPDRICTLNLPRHSAFTRLPLPKFSLIGACRHLIILTLKYQFPLLGLPLRDIGINTYYGDLVKSLPPSLSLLTFDGELAGNVTENISRNATGYPTLSFTQPKLIQIQTWPLESAFHVANAASWILLLLCGPSVWRQNTWLQAYMASGALGSAITAPLLLRKMYNSGVVLPRFESTVRKAFFIWIGVASIVTLPFHLMLAFGVGSTQSHMCLRMGALIFSSICSMLRNHLVQSAR